MDRIDQQRKEVFGPLRGLMQQNASAMNFFLRKQREEGIKASGKTNKGRKAAEKLDKHPKTKAAGDSGNSIWIKLLNKDTTTADNQTPLQKNWIMWLTNVLQPANRKMKEIIVEKSWLFNSMDDSEGEVMSNILGHIAEQDIILLKIEAKVFDHLAASIGWDTRFNKFVNSEYDGIMERRDKLLKTTLYSEDQEVKDDASGGTGGGGGYEEDDASGGTGGGGGGGHDRFEYALAEDEGGGTEEDDDDDDDGNFGSNDSDLENGNTSD